MVVLSAAAAAAGCSTHQCDPSTVTFDGGHMVDDDTYETNALDEAWIHYPPNVTLIVDYSSIVGKRRVPVSIEPYIGLSSTPNAINDAGTTWTNASGGVALSNDLNGSGFLEFNTTCVDYYARFVVHFEPASHEEDAGADASIAPGTAVGDAASDSMSD